MGIRVAEVEDYDKNLPQPGNVKQAAASLISKMSKEERNEYLERLKEINESLEDDTPEPSA